MRRRTRAIGAAIIAAVCVLVSIAKLAAPASRVESSQAIRLGMSRDEVQRILRGPPGDFRRDPQYLIRDGVSPISTYVGSIGVPIREIENENGVPTNVERWIEEGSEVMVAYDKNDQVAGVYWLQISPWDNRAWYEILWETVRKLF